MIKYNKIFILLNVMFWLVIVLQVYNIIDIGSVGIKIVLFLTICNSLFMLFIKRDVNKQHNNF